MKKLFLLIGLVVFLTPMVVSAKEGWIKPINLKRDSSSCVNYVDEFGVDCSAYVVKSDIACFTKAKLKSKNCPIDTFEIFSLGLDTTHWVGKTNYSSIAKNYTLYKIVESKNIKDVEWIKVCPYGSTGTRPDRYGVKFKDCGWTNEINEFQLASSLLPEIDPELKKVDLPESDLIHSNCIKTSSDLHCFCKRPYGGVYKSRLGSVNNITDYCANERYGNYEITLKEYLEYGGEYQIPSDATSVDDVFSLFIYCKKTDSEFDYVSAWPVEYSPCPDNDVQVSLDEYKEYKQEQLKEDLEWAKWLGDYNLQQSQRQQVCFRQGYSIAKRGEYENCMFGRSQNIKTASSRTASYDEFAIALGCGIKRKDVDDCVRRYLPHTIGTGPMTMEQINEVKNNRVLMGEVVSAIEEMARANSQSNEPSEEEKRQAQAEGGYYKEQSNGNYVWVDTRSGAEKFTDRFCYNCSAAQVYMINRATKRYFQNAPLSGFDKFILRGGNTRKVIKVY